MNAHLILPVIQALFCLVLMAVVFKGHFRSFTHRLFSLFLLSLAVWGIIIFSMRASPDVNHAYFWEKWLIPLGPLTATLFYHFSVRYTATRIKDWLIPLFYVFSVLSIPLLVTTDLLVRGMQIKPYGYAPILGPILPLWLLFSYLLFIIALVYFVRVSINSQYAEQRNRAAYITAGIGFMLAGVIFDILPLLGLPLYPGLIIGNIIFCLLVTVAIVRHNLLDIRVVIRKGTAYVLTSAVAAVPFVVIFLLATRVFTEVDFPLWAYFIVAIVLAFALPHLWQWVQLWVNRWFYRDRYDYLKALETFIQQTQSLTSSDRLSFTMVNLLAKALRSSNVYLFQPSPPDNDFTTVSTNDNNNPAPAISLKKDSAIVKWLERSNSMLFYGDIEIIPQLQGTTSKEKQILQQVGAELISPLKAPTGQLSGILILGKKLSEQTYNSEDKQLIYTICNHMSTNLENMRLYNESQHEISERKKAEQALADEATRRRILIGQSLDGIVVLNENAKVYEANRKFAEMLGYTLEEVRELHTWDWDKNFPPEKLLEMGRNVDEKGLRLETQHHRKDGSVIDVDISINGVVIAGQKLIFCVCRDVTERKRAEQALKAEKNKLQSLIDAMEDDLSIQDRDYNIIYQNEPSRISSGGDCTGEKCHRAYEGKDEVDEDCPVKKAFKDGKSHTSERKWVKPSGEVIFWETTANPIRDAEGNIVSCLEVARNITERKRAEEREKEMQQELLLSSRLASIGELAAGVAHQLNNPLTGILGFSQHILRKVTDQETSQDLRKIYGEAERAAKIVQNLLTFARRRQPKKEYSDVNNVVQSALELRAYELKTSNIEVKTKLAPSLPKIMLDFHQIQEVFLNLILNAEQAMIEANGGGRLTVKTEKNKGCVRCTFSDDGPGIPPENLDNIFDPFFTTKGERGGTGLGLSVCHGIIGEHGGKIYAKSKQSKGTTFFVELPIVAEE